MTKKGEEIEAGPGDLEQEVELKRSKFREIDLNHNKKYEEGLQEKWMHTLIWWKSEQNLAWVKQDLVTNYFPIPFLVTSVSPLKYLSSHVDDDFICGWSENDMN